MSLLTRILSVLLALGITSCYHATVETALTSSADTIEESWASGWIFGLVPPNTISTQAKCPNGVAKVETQLSFLNQLVGLITLGIYTPMEIKVTCASKGTADSSLNPDILIDGNATPDEVSRAFMEAAEIAVEEGRAVFVAY